MPGTTTIITTQNTDFDALVVPLNRLYRTKSITIHNRSNTDIRVWSVEEFTDTDGTVHTTGADQVYLFDYPVASQDAITVLVEKRIMNQLTLQAVGANIAVATPVVVSVEGEWEV